MRQTAAKVTLLLVSPIFGTSVRSGHEFIGHLHLVVLGSFPSGAPRDHRCDSLCVSDCVSDCQCERGEQLDCV